jgi:hypothetical protein
MGMIWQKICRFLTDSITKTDLLENISITNSRASSDFAREMLIPQA